MKNFILLATFSAIICLSYGEKDVGPEPLPPSSSEAPITSPPTTVSTTTTVSPTTPSTTKPSTSTTTSPITPSPTTPSTTTPSTTTPSTTTPSTTTTSTTTASTTTPSTTTTKPTPVPKPEVHTWIANYTGSNLTCIVLKMILKVEIPYQKMDNKTVNTTVLIPKTADAKGDCVLGALEQKLTLTWSPEQNISDSVLFTFKMNKTDNKFVLNSVVAQITPDSVNFPNAKSKNMIVANHTHSEFITPVAMSYRCKQNEYLSFPLGENVTSRFIVSNLQVQAFRNTTNDNFDSAKDCEAGETPGIVPIAVGCSLAILIIIVLVTYLLGRRRSQARGYLSM